MRAFPRLIAILMAVFVANTTAIPVVKVHPGDASDIIITKENTINATNPAPPNENARVLTASNGHLQVSMVNNFPGGAINAYVTGLDASNRLVMLQQDGTFYYPSANGNTGIPQPITANCAIPLGAKGSTTTITIPGYISSARIWFAEGYLKFYTVYSAASGGPSLVQPSSVNPSDPSAGVNWGFVELTNIENGGLYANISYVYFVGLVLGMKLQTTDGGIQVAEGLQVGSVSSICSALKAQSLQDGQPWGDLCQVNSQGVALRIIAPSDYVASNPAAFSDYWTEHIEEVWKRFTRRSLIVNTQTSLGQVSCKVSNSQLNCAGDNRSYSKPTALDIFGCNSGPFGILADDNEVHRAVVPRLCAAFHRGTLLIRGGHIQPGVSAASYYTAMPSNWYSKFVHQYETDGKGYAFPYDDVNPDIGIDQAGVVAAPNPKLLTVTVGGPSTGW